MGESAAESLTREMREELGLDVTIGRLVYVMEYFFGYGGKRYHELGWYFLVDLPSGWYPLNDEGPFVRMDGDAELVFERLPIDARDRHSLFPSFFTSGVALLPEETAHVVVHDDWAPP